MNIEGDEDHKRDDNNDDCKPAEVHLMLTHSGCREPSNCDCLSSTMNVWMQGRKGIKEVSQAAKLGGGRPWDREWAGDGTVPFQGDGYQHVVRRGQGEGLKKL